MLISKRMVLLALLSMAAVSLEVGCAGNDSKATGAKHTLATQPGAAKDGKNGKTSPAGAGAATPADAAKQAANLSAITDFEKKLQTATAVTREDLKAGTYSLQAVHTVFNYYFKGKTDENLSALHATTVSTDSNKNILLVDSEAPQVGGTMTNDTDVINGRQLGLPVSFTLDGKAFPAWKDASETKIQDYFDKGAGKLTDKFVATNDFYRDTGDDKSSVIDILKTTSADAKDAAYVTADQKNVPIYVRLLQVDAQTYRIYVSIEEKPLGTGNESMTRNFYLDYKFVASAPNAPSAPATAAPAADPAATPAAAQPLPVSTGDTAAPTQSP